MYFFLFDSEHAELTDSVFYGPPCTKSVVAALERLDPAPTARLIRGNVSPQINSYRLAHFRVGSNAMCVEAPATEPFASAGDTFRYQPDHELFKTIICDLAETLSEPPSTVSSEQLLLCLARCSVWAVGAALTCDHALQLDRTLKSFAPYLGMAALDLGNPTHRSIMIESLFHDDYIFTPAGIIYKAETYLPPEDQHEALVLARELGSAKEPIALEWEAFAAALPPLVFPDNLSERGELSRQRIAGKRAPIHRERLAAALLNRFEETTAGGQWEFSTARREGVQEFEFDPRKFLEYLLNEEHAKGGAKAKFFVTGLDIQPQDWRFLADQIERAMATAPLYRADKKEWGYSHGALVSIVGRNGKRAVVETGWMIDASGPARFVTAYPYDGDIADQLDYVTEPNVVDLSLVGDAKWSAIYDRAVSVGEAAARRVQPTPMVLETYGTIWDGMCGFGWVLLPSARHPMAKWLVKTGFGSKAYRAGVSVWSTAATQSVDRNRAWAEAFASVLKANGIDCSAHHRLD